jgi:hypothetical protein
VTGVQTCALPISSPCGLIWNIIKTSNESQGVHS